MWWYENSNQILQGAVEEPDRPGIREPPALFNFLEDIKKRFGQSSSEDVMNLETFRPKTGDGVETIFSNFNEIVEVVEGTRAYTPTMLANEFHSYLPANIKSLMAARYMEEGMRRVREDEEPMNREEIRVMAAEQEVWVATAAAADRMAGIFVTPPPMPTPRPNPTAYQPYAQGGRPAAPTPQPARQGGVCYNCYQPGHKRAACPYTSTAQMGGQPAGGGGDAAGGWGGGYAQ